MIMTIRWLKQRTLSSCGPVALLNLKKWLGHNVSYARDFNYWKNLCGTARYGSPLSNFVEALYSIDGIKITPRSNPNIQLIDESLKSDRAIVMKSAFMFEGKLMGHYFLVTDRSSKAFYCINATENKTADWWSKASFQANWMQNHTNYCYECGIAPYVWIIRKI